MLARHRATPWSSGMILVVSRVRRLDPFARMMDRVFSRSDTLRYVTSLPKRCHPALRRVEGAQRRMGKGERILYSAPALPIRRLELAWLRRDENPRLPVLRRLKLAKKITPYHSTGIVRPNPNCDPPPSLKSLTRKTLMRAKRLRASPRSQ